MKIEPKDIQVGDKFTISGTVRRRLGVDIDVDFDGSADWPIELALKHLTHAVITRPPKALAVNDRVRTRTGAIGVIVDLHRDIAWIEPEPGKVWPLTPDDKSPLPINASTLTRIEENNQ